MDIVFVTPNTKNLITHESIGTLLLATILKNSGLNSEVLQFAKFGELDQFNEFLDNAVCAICSRKPKILSFYARCDNYHITLKIAQRIKQIYNPYIVFGGPHADITAIPTMEEIPYVDFVCCGEGETTIVPFFTSLLQDVPDLSIPGLVYRRNGHVISNPRPALVQDLDTLPLVDYSLANLPHPDEKGYFPIDVGRGCPFGCTYCSTSLFWGRRYRLKTPQRLVEEIMALNRQYHIRNFELLHDMFTFKRSVVLEFCRLVQESPIDIRWYCGSRLDCLDKPLIDACAAAGMDCIHIGIETGSPRMQTILNKNLKLDGLMDTMKYIRSKNIKIFIYFMHGLPEETEEDISYTLGIIGDLAAIGGIDIQTSLCAFLPGTEMTERYGDQLTPAKQLFAHTGTAGVRECADLISAHPEIFKHFQEYKTELRTRLIHFPLFCKLWFIMPPVFAYLRRKYTPDTLIQLYFAFLDDNKALLENMESLPTKADIMTLLKSDSLFRSFQNDERYDIIKDFQQMALMLYPGQVESETPVVKIFCFSPNEAKYNSDLETYERKCTAAIYTRDSNNPSRITIKIADMSHPLHAGDAEN